MPIMARVKHEDAYYGARYEVGAHPEESEDGQHRRENPDEKAASALLEKNHVEDVDADRTAFERRPKPGDGGQNRRHGICTLLVQHRNDWRWVAELNRCKRICSPLPNRSANPPMA